MIFRQLTRVLLFLLFIAVCFSTATVLNLLDKIRGKYHDRSTFAKRYLRWFCQLSGMKIRSSGTPHQGACLVVSNHISWTDIPVLGSLLPVYFLSKAEVRSWPVIGALAEQAGTLFIQRGDGKSSGVREQIEDQLHKQNNVLIFPEGTTTNGLELLKFHSKLIAAAINVESAIQPITLSYQNWSGAPCMDTPFIDDDEFPSHLWRLFSKPRTKVRVHFHPVIHTTRHTDISVLTTQIQNQIEKQLHANNHSPGAKGYPILTASR